MDRLDDYMKTTEETAIYPGKGYCSFEAINYALIGLLGEAGEIANKWKKVLRGDANDHGMMTPDQRSALLAECGDVAWYLTRLCAELGSDLGTAMTENKARLLDRMERGKLAGDGDNR